MVGYITALLWNILRVVTALSAAFYAYYKWTYQYWKRRGVPYIEPKIPFGNVKNPFTPVDRIVSEIYKKAKAKGWKYCGIYSTLTPVFLVIDLNLVKDVLMKDFQHFTDRGIYTNEKDDPVGCHLFALEGAKWRNLRAKLTPTFTSGKLKSMFQTLVDCGVALEQYIDENIKDQPVDIKNVLACFGTDVIGSCAFGLDCNSFKEPDSLFRRYGNKVFTMTKTRMMKFILASNFPSLARTLGLTQVDKDVANFFSKVVTDSVNYREKNNVDRKDFLQLLIDIRAKDEEENTIVVSEDSTKLTMGEIVAQSFLFFVAGFETSSSTTTFALFELATHPEIQDRVREEINTVLSKHQNKMTYDSLAELKYMKQVIYETLRLYSPVRTLRRICTKDYKIPGEDVVIQKGTKVIIPATCIHYDEEYWKNPKEFDPDRFSEENKSTMKQFSLLPFGEGPRICIGERFGLMQVKVGLTCLLRKYKITLNNKTKLPLSMSPTSVVSSAEGGIWLDLEKI